jgi:hypothetical protein
MDACSSSARRAWLRPAAAGLLVLAVAAGLAVWLMRRNPAPAGHSSNDPRRSYTGPYRNIDPDVAYVGDAHCAPCHHDKEESYRRHPMANTLLPIAQVATAEPLDAAHHNPFRAFASRFSIELQGDHVLHRQVRLDAAGKPVCELTHKVRYSVGSGNHGRSFISERDGFLCQTPISWYGQKQIWDASPGFRLEYLPGRPISAGCLFCHSNRPQAEEDANNRFRTPVFANGHAIGCERCHGPGSLHAESSHKLDIVNPKNLPWRLREAVCEQCHLEGLIRSVRGGRRVDDFRPGLPLELFWTIEVHAGPGEDRKAVSHVEQMYQSKCFRAGSDDNKMGCVSCHDPHVKVGADQRVAHYRDRCLRCHSDHPCSLGLEERRARQPDDSCIACHMPRFASSDIAHTASTDHRIPRDPAKPAGVELRPDYPDIPAASFYGDRLPPGDEDVARDQALALVQLAIENDAPPLAATRRALPLLDAALRRDPEDLRTLEARADALRLATRLLEALNAYEAVLARAPRRESALFYAAVLAGDLHRTEAAIGYWQRLVSVNPWMPSYRRPLVRLLEEAGRIDEVREHAEAWRRLEPTSIDARRVWLRLLLRDGRKDEARAEEAVLQGLDPSH